eukprot:Lankesteria_metandrocarpae@DN1164_c0_g1_i2.p1
MMRCCILTLKGKSVVLSCFLWSVVCVMSVDKDITPNPLSRDQRDVPPEVCGDLNATGGTNQGVDPLMNKLFTPAFEDFFYKFYSSTDFDVPYPKYEMGPLISERTAVPNPPPVTPQMSTDFQLLDDIDIQGLDKLFQNIDSGPL